MDRESPLGFLCPHRRCIVCSCVCSSDHNQQDMNCWDLSTSQTSSSQSSADSQPLWAEVMQSLLSSSQSDGTSSNSCLSLPLFFHWGLFSAYIDYNLNLKSLSALFQLLICPKTFPSCSPANYRHPLKSLTCRVKVNQIDTWWLKVPQPCVQRI